MKLAEKISRLPQKPGIYQFLNAAGKVIYIGKAKNLRARVRQYFGHDDQRPQIPFLMAEAADISYAIVSNELESAFLENTLIKQYNPKYNIDLRDDKNYAFIKIDYSTEIPQIGYARKVEQKSQTNPKSIYFGPYSAAYKIRNTLNLVRKIFSFCSNSKVGRRPCFYYYMHRCPGVCVGKMSLNDYRAHLQKIAKFLQGDTAGVRREIKTEMRKAARAIKVETAARLRDQLRALDLLNEKQAVILPKKVDWDIVSLAIAENYSCVNLFKVRGGKLYDKENFIYQLPEQWLGQGGPQAMADILQTFLQKYYLETSSLPREIFCQSPAKDARQISQLIYQRTRENIKLLTPQRGHGVKLLQLGATNAEEYLKNWLSAQAGHLDRVQASLAQLQQALNLKTLPKRVECYDISNIQGTNAVGSMVVFKDGQPAKSEYRKFKIKSKSTPDDFAMMQEMLSRRLARLNANDRKFSKPDLIVIDGGKGQLNAALEILRANKQTLPIIGLAKRIEEIFLPHQSQPIVLAHDQPALQLLQRLRDEAHRFGITFHRQLRSRQAVRSALDEIAGIGPKTKKLLKTRFGTVADIRAAKEADLADVVGRKLAQSIKQTL